MKTFVALLFAFATVASAQQLEPAALKMYDRPNVEPNPMCDVHTSLTLDNGALTGAFGVLEGGLDGACEIYVPRNSRFFRLIPTGTSCGSKIFEGEIEQREGRFDVKVTDHRTRLCDDLVPALVVVEVTDQSTGRTQTLYSHTR